VVILIIILDVVVVIVKVIIINTLKMRQLGVADKSKEKAVLVFFFVLA